MDEDLGLPDDDFEGAAYSPQDASRIFQQALKVLDETPARLALRMQRLGDHRPLGTITRAIQRMAAGETKVSGEMQVIMQMMVRERAHAKEDAQRLRWSLVGSNMTAGTRDFAISLSPQTRGRWKVSVTHIPSRYSPPWPVWQTSLEDAKIKAILCIEDAAHDPELAATLKSYGQPPVLAQAAPPVCSNDYLALAVEMNAIALDVLNRVPQAVASAVAKIAIGLSLQAARLGGEAILASLGWTVGDLRKCRNHDLLTLLRQAETAIQESGNSELRSYRHFTLVPPVVDGKKFGGTIAGYLQNHLGLGPAGAPENYFNADEPNFSMPDPPRAIHDMTAQLLDAADKVVRIAQPA